MAFHEAQLQAIHHREGPMMVLAGPGSGKTTVITHRVKYLVEQCGVEPGSILVITFTKAAAQEMRQRFEKLMEGRRLPVSFGTFHAVFFSILKRAYRYDASNIAREEQRTRIIRELVDKLRMDVEDEAEFTSQILTEISLVKGEMMDLDYYYSKNCSEELFKKLYQGYEKAMMDKGLLDFDDMLVLCYELISMLTERNNLHDVDTWMFFKYFVKAWVAIYLVSNTFTITMAVFDVGQSVVNSASGIINGETAIDVSSLSMQMQAAMATMEIGELVVLALETFLVSFCMKIMSVVITVIVYGRMIEIYLYTSLAPIPFATMCNREWGHVGTNYFRGLFALAFQAFLMMVCVAIYAALISSVRISSNMHSALIGVAAYTVILCFSLMKTGSLSKQIFGSH